MMSTGEIDLGHLLLKGGPMMVPIILCSVFALAIVVEKLFYFSSAQKDFLKFKQDIVEHLSKNKIKEAVIICEQNPSAIARIFKAGIMKFGVSREAAKEAMHEAIDFETFLLEKKCGILSAISQIAPLLGLLGTAIGMAQSFYVIHLKSGSLAPVTTGELADGIWQALMTTIVGLVVAVLTLVAYKYLLSRIDDVVMQMRRAVVELLDCLYTTLQ